jgi:hypothetical protein
MVEPGASVRRLDACPPQEGRAALLSRRVRAVAYALAGGAGNLVPVFQRARISPVPRAPRLCRLNFVTHASPLLCSTRNQFKKGVTMKNWCKITLGSAAVAALACVGLAMAQSENPSRRVAQQAMAVERVQESHMLGVSLVRFLNNSESDYKAKEGKYADWEELENSAYFLAGKGRWAQTEGVTISSGPEIIPGWRLSLLRSADGASYQLMLQNAGDKICMFSFFSDQSGLIYQGQVINCPAHVVPTRN